jgi:hypothetical protein
VTVSDTAPVPRVVIDNYLKRSEINITPAHRRTISHGNVLNRVDARCRAVTCLRTEFSPFVCDEPPSEGRYADYRSGPRLQKVEPVSHPEAFAFEIGRVRRSCVKQSRQDIWNKCSPLGGIVGPSHLVVYLSPN